MATNDLLVSFDRSPICKKRARLELDEREIGAWTLSKNELSLHAILDEGIDVLSTDVVLDLGIETENGNITIESLYSTPNPPVCEIPAEETVSNPPSIENAAPLKLTVEEFDQMQLVGGGLNDVNSNVLGLDYFQLMSDEVVLQILQFLPRKQLGNVALVCRRFSKLTEDETLWARMDVSSRILEPGAIGAVLSRQVITLRMSHATILSPGILENNRASDEDFICRMMYLDLTMATVSHSTLTKMFEKCTNLRNLSLESVSINCSVLRALSNSRKLQVLNLAMATGIQISGLKYLLTNCRKITELNLSWVYLDAECVEYVCANLPSSVNRLNFSGCRKCLDDSNVSYLVANCPALTELDLSDCHSLTGKVISTLLFLDKLNFLAMSRCYLVPMRCLLLLKKMKSLRYLDIYGTYTDRYDLIEHSLGLHVSINKFKFSSVARPTVGNKKAYIWNQRVAD